jgi:hypothetical protein
MNIEIITALDFTGPAEKLKEVAAAIADTVAQEGFANQSREDDAPVVSVIFVRESKRGEYNTGGDYLQSLMKSSFYMCLPFNDDVVPVKETHDVNKEVEDDSTGD